MPASRFKMASLFVEIFFETGPGQDHAGRHYFLESPDFGVADIAPLTCQLLERQLLQVDWMDGS